MKSIRYFYILLIVFSCTKSKQTEVSKEVQVAPAKKAVAQLLSPRLKVEVKRLDSLVWEGASENQDLFSRDTIKTGAGASGVVAFMDGSLLQVNENSTITITDYKETQDLQQSVVSLPSGSVRGEIKETVSKPVEMSIRTHQGWVRVRNRDKDNKQVVAKFSAQVDEAGKAEFAIEEGAADYITKDSEQALNPGEKLTVAGDGSAKSDFENLPEIKQSQIKKISINEKKSDMPKASATNENEFTLISPKNGDEVDAAKVSLKGKIGKNMKAFVNGRELKDNGQGEFSFSHSLNPGVNLLVIQVVNNKTKAVEYKNLEIKRK